MIFYNVYPILYDLFPLDDKKVHLWNWAILIINLFASITWMENYNNIREEFSIPFIAKYIGDRIARVVLR